MDFLEEYATALAIGGTVAIPSPFPASGRLYVVSKIDSQGELACFVKVVQIVNETEFRTWFFKLNDVRAIKCRADENDSAASHGPWLFKSRDELKQMLDQKLPARNGDDAHEVEFLLASQAIAYVPEATPVITRHEYAMTAAESVEDACVAFCPVCPPPCCHKTKI